MAGLTDEAGIDVCVPRGPGHCHNEEGVRGRGMSSARLLVLTSQAGTQMSTKVRNYCHRIMKLQRLDIKKRGGIQL